MFCPKCGSEVSEGLKFCGSCGSRMPEQEPQQNVFEQAAPQQNVFEQAAPQQNVFEQRPVQQATPQQNVFEQRPVQQAAPQQNAFGQAAPQQNAFGQAAPQQNVYEPKEEGHPVADLRKKIACAAPFLIAILAFTCYTILQFFQSIGSIADEAAFLGDVGDVGVIATAGWFSVAVSVVMLIFSLATCAALWMIYIEGGKDTPIMPTNGLFVMKVIYMIKMVIVGIGTALLAVSYIQISEAMQELGMDQETIAKATSSLGGKIIIYLIVIALYWEVVKYLKVAMQSGVTMKPKLDVIDVLMLLGGGIMILAAVVNMAMESSGLAEGTQIVMGASYIFFAISCSAFRSGIKKLRAEAAGAGLR